MGEDLREIKSFLEVTCYEGSAHGRARARSGLYPFVTISRQYGAGGRALAHVLLREMDRCSSDLFRGWKVFDRQLFESLIRERKLRSAFDSVFSEECHSEIEALVRTFLGGTSGQPAAIDEMFRAIRTVATWGKVIIVGRAGSCVTRSLPLGVHLRLVASEQYRIRQMGLDKVSDGEARKELHARDRDRARLVQRHFRRNIADPTLYDAVWNAEQVPLGAIARATLVLLEDRVARLQLEKEASRGRREKEVAVW